MPERILVEIDNNSPIPPFAVGDDPAQIPPGDVASMEGGKCVGATPGVGPLEGKTVVWYASNLGPGKTPPASLGSFTDGPKTYKYFDPIADYAAGSAIFIF